MPYLTPRERLAILYAIGIAASIIITCVGIAGATGMLFCPADTFC